jgi:hypothetical protein
LPKDYQTSGEDYKKKHHHKKKGKKGGKDYASYENANDSVADDYSDHGDFVSMNFVRG